MIKYLEKESKNFVYVFSENHLLNIIFLDLELKKITKISMSKKSKNFIKVLKTHKYSIHLILTTD
jgi:hypothetical protein